MNKMDWIIIILFIIFFLLAFPGRRTVFVVEPEITPTPTPTPKPYEINPFLEKVYV